jgi:hypothetical protein
MPYEGGFYMNAAKSAFAMFVAVFAFHADLACAQSLVGQWDSMFRTADGYNLPQRFTWNANGTFMQSIAVPPNRQTGAGSGMIYIQGVYRMTSPNSVQFKATQAKVCASGTSFCTPYPQGLGENSFEFEWNGPNQYSTDAGTAHRVGSY